MDYSIKNRGATPTTSTENKETTAAPTESQPERSGGFSALSGFLGGGGGGGGGGSSALGGFGSMFSGLGGMLGSLLGGGGGLGSLLGGGRGAGTGSAGGAGTTAGTGGSTRPTGTAGGLGGGLGGIMGFAMEMAGRSTGPSMGGKVELSAEDVAKLQNAPTMAEATKLAKGMLKEKTGTSTDFGTLNRLYGTNIRQGNNRGRASTKLLDKVAASVAEQARSGASSAPRTASATPAAPAASASPGIPVTAPTKGGHPAAQQTVPPPAQQTPGKAPPAPGGEKPEPSGPSTGKTVDVGPMKPEAERIAELTSPLIFDLAGVGMKIKRGKLLHLDLDGDGRMEVFTNLDPGIGVLIFDAKQNPETGAARHMFGNGTDLSVYGVEGPDGDTFPDGFAALRALAAHFERINEKKQFLDAHDLAFLEEKCGLRMRTGGLQGKDLRFASLGITRIDLGHPKQTQTLEAAEEDAFGNRLMRQPGASFTVNGVTREYADIWFNIQARIPVKAAA